MKFNLFNPVDRMLLAPPVTARAGAPAPANVVAVRSTVRMLVGPVTSQAAVRQIPLNDRTPDSYQIIRVIADLQDQYARMPAIREFTVRLLAGVPNDAQDEQARRVLAFVRDAMQYVRDPVGSEYIIAPDKLLAQISAGGRAAGDCDDHVLLLNAMLGSIGFEAMPVGVRLPGSATFDHVISSVKIFNQWRDLDPCVKGGFQPSYSDKLFP